MVQYPHTHGLIPLDLLLFSAQTSVKSTELFLIPLGGSNGQGRNMDR
jgi:hypothetical protein